MRRTNFSHKFFQLSSTQQASCHPQQHTTSILSSTTTNNKHPVIHNNIISYDTPCQLLLLSATQHSLLIAELRSLASLAQIWLYLEEAQIPYKVSKVTMFCYGEKEPAYKSIVPSGMLPAMSLDGNIITESDQLLFHLEEVFGPMLPTTPLLSSPAVLPKRKLERKLFGAWCDWLCSKLD